MASDLKSDLELAIKLGQDALKVAQKWAAYNAGKILVEPPVSESYEMKRAFSRFKKSCETIDRRLEEQKHPRNIKRLIAEYEQLKGEVAQYKSQNTSPAENPKVFFTMLAKDCESKTPERFALGNWALKILDVDAKDGDGQLLIDHGHFRFKNGSRVFPPESDRPAITTWKILRALLSTPHNLGVTLLEIKNPASVMQRKKNRAVAVETWQDHVLACDKFGNPVNRGNGKHMYRLMPESVR